MLAVRLYVLFSVSCKGQPKVRKEVPCLLLLLTQSDLSKPVYSMLA